MTSAPGTSAEARKPRAFVLDDDAAVRDLVVRMLAKNGFDASGFATQLDMVVKLRPVPPDLIVLDLTLGKSDAIDVMRQLATLKVPSKLLLMSGRDEATLNEVAQIGLRHGLAMLPSLRKPFRADSLIERVHAAAQRSETSDVLDLADAAGSDVTLADALRNHWLELWYQPKVELKTVSVRGAEALLRARHPQHGIIAPAQILPPSESPLYQELYKFVVRRAMVDWTAFAEVRASLKLAINLPVATVCAPDFIGNLRLLLSEDPRFPGLIIEVTGDALTRDPQWAHDVASQLKLYNVVLSIDDFGLAHSSLAQLTDLPCVEIKLARKFVDGCAADAQKHEVCRLLIGLAHRFGASACAVGVETIEDLRALKALDCDTAQGFLFAKPMEPAQFLDMLRASSATQAA
jgi:EAL domain-containing protein (putative c-di-GMP-specific phosphodiesterase class I)/FixJ family two-component response regulator